MTQRKFEPETTGGYWVRNIEGRETDGSFVLQAMIGNHSSQPPSDDPLDWHVETFKADGSYRIDFEQSPFDLIEEAQ